MPAKSKALLFLILIPFFGTIPSAVAQSEYIVVEKSVSNRQIKYESGDKIVYKLKGEDFFRNDVIVALNDTAIEFHYQQILYNEIAEVDVRGKRFSGTNWRSIGTKIQIVGIGYIAIDQFNQVVVRGEDPSFNENVWIAGGLIYIGGSVLKRLSPKKVKLNGKYRIRYMNIKPSTVSITN
jgi:hypothetical protein